MRREQLAWTGSTLASALVVSLGAALCACSALVDPDESRLGGARDAGSTERRDGTVPPIDAVVDPDSSTTDAVACAGGCEDAVDCTDDSCGPSGCTHAPNDALCGEGSRCNPVMGCVSTRCASDAECNDGVPCNGEETCAPGGDGADPVTGCRAGVALGCDDGRSCTNDSCIDTMGGCVFAPDPTSCDDGVACTRDACDPSASDDSSGCVRAPDDSLCATSFCRVGSVCSAESGCVGGDVRDCRDFDACTTDTCSDTLMVCEHAPRDADLDGFPTRSIGGASCPGGTDCNDLDATVFPGAMEACNGRDDNCNEMIDETCPRPPDTCMSAQAIPLTSATTITGTIATFSDNFRTSCGDSGGRDAIYYIDVATPSDITIDTIGSGATDTVLAVGTTCGTWMACDDDLDSGRTLESRIFVHRFGGGATTSSRLYIMVDGFDGSTTGSFTLNVSVRPAAADSCGSGNIDINGGGTLLGWIASGVSSERGSCQGLFSGGEAIATFLGPPDGTASFTAFSADFSPELYVRAEPCHTGAEVGCTRGSLSGSVWRAQLDTSVRATGSYFLFVDGASFAGSAYSVYYEP